MALHQPVGKLWECGEGEGALGREAACRQKAVRAGRWGWKEAGGLGWLLVGVAASPDWQPRPT